MVQIEREFLGKLRKRFKLHNVLNKMTMETNLYVFFSMCFVSPTPGTGHLTHSNHSGYDSAEIALGEASEVRPVSALFRTHYIQDTGQWTQCPL